MTLSMLSTCSDKKSDTVSIGYCEADCSDRCVTLKLCLLVSTQVCHWSNKLCQISRCESHSIQSGMNDIYPNMTRLIENNVCYWQFWVLLWKLTSSDNLPSCESRVWSFHLNYSPTIWSNSSDRKGPTSWLRPPVSLPVCLSGSLKVSRFWSVACWTNRRVKMTSSQNLETPPPSRYRCWDIFTGKLTC